MKISVAEVNDVFFVYCKTIFVIHDALYLCYENQIY